MNGTGLQARLMVNACKFHITILQNAWCCNMEMNEQSKLLGFVKAIEMVSLSKLHAKHHTHYCARCYHSHLKRNISRKRQACCLRDVVMHGRSGKRKRPEENWVTEEEVLSAMRVDRHIFRSWSAAVVVDLGVQELRVLRRVHSGGRSDVAEDP